MINHVLVAVDGSSHGRSAAEFALGLARRVNAKVTLLTVLPLPEVLPMGPLSGFVVTAPALSKTDLDQVDARLKELVKTHEGVEVRTVVEVGPVADTIVETSKRLQVDLLVVGARGLGAAGRFFLGSVSDRVAHLAHCPVLVWRQTMQAASGMVVAAVDGSEPALKGARWAAELARAIGATLQLTYASFPALLIAPTYETAIQRLEEGEAEHAKQVLADAAKHVEDLGVKCVQTRLIGAAAEAVTDLAMGEHVWGVVVGARGRNAVSRVMLGSVADRLMHICQRPVVVVR